MDTEECHETEKIGNVSRCTDAAHDGRAHYPLLIYLGKRPPGDSRLLRHPGPPGGRHGGGSRQQCCRAVERLRLDGYLRHSGRGAYHTLGLKSDGTVVAVGSNGHGQTDVSSWTGITAIAAGTNHTVGLKSNGTVVGAGDNGAGQSDFSSWTGLTITAIAAGGDNTVGLKSDGTVVTVGDNTYGQLSVSSWTNIVAIAAGTNHTVGLKSNGTVVTTASNGDISSWTNIVAVAGGYDYTVGLKSDGTDGGGGGSFLGPDGSLRLDGHSRHSDRGTSYRGPQARRYGGGAGV